jgi:hypothetical protein
MSSRIGVVGGSSVVVLHASTDHEDPSNETIFEPRILDSKRLLSQHEETTVSDFELIAAQGRTININTYHEVMFTIQTHREILPSLFVEFDKG